ncbi:MAG: hypothetical protein AAF198_04775 [Pseudomonadota bacterium]
MSVLNSDIDFRGIYRMPNRKEAYSKLSPVTWVPAAKCWFVTDPEAITKIMKNYELEVINMADELALLSEAMGTSLTHTDTFLLSTALTQNGERHKKLRKAVVNTIREKGPMAESAFETEIQNRLSDVFEQSSEVDLIADVIVPAVRAFVQMLADPDPGLVDRASVLIGSFDPYLSLRSRQKIEEAAAGFFPINPDDPEAKDRIFRNALGVMANDTMVGSMGIGLYNFFVSQIGKRVDQMPWSQASLAATVSFTDRIAMETVKYGETTIQKGGRIRFCFGVNDVQNQSDKTMMFGRGHHLCPGARPAQNCFDIVKREFSKLKLTLANVDMAFSEDGFIAIVPDHLKIRVSHG